MGLYNARALLLPWRGTDARNRINSKSVSISICYHTTLPGPWLLAYRGNWHVTRSVVKTYIFESLKIPPPKPNIGKKLAIYHCLVFFILLCTMTDLPISSFIVLCQMTQSKYLKHTMLINTKFKTKTILRKSKQCCNIDLISFKTI